MLLNKWHKTFQNWKTEVNIENKKALRQISWNFRTRRMKKGSFMCQKQPGIRLGNHYGIGFHSNNSGCHRKWNNAPPKFYAKIILLTQLVMEPLLKFFNHFSLWDIKIRIIGMMYQIVHNPNLCDFPLFSSLLSHIKKLRIL
jgi:hypothetical protein